MTSSFDELDGKEILDGAADDSDEELPDIVERPISPAGAAARQQYGAKVPPIVINAEHDDNVGDGGTSRYPQRKREHPSNWWEVTKAQALLADGEFPEPQNEREALNCDDAAQWRKAMDEEMTSLLENGTWVLEKTPKGVQAYPCQVDLQD